MKTPYRSKATYYAQRVGTLLVAIALIASMIGCQNNGGNGSTGCALAIASTAGGSVTTPTEGTHTYEYGEVVNLVATPDPHHHFVAWTGDVGNIDNDTAAQTTITMEGNYSITASFAQNQYTLTVNIVGDGSIGRDPDQATYTYGTEVDLTATADPGWTFAGWSGDLTGDASPVTITMDGSKTVTATFTQDPYTLTIDIVGEGSVTREPDQAIYVYGTEVELTATAATGWTFDGWSGDLIGAASPDTITMDGDKTVTATFTQDQYTLTIDIVGEGSVTRDPDQATYAYGTEVELTATADPGRTFAGWSGDLIGTTSPDTVIMDGNKTVTATFAIDTHSLTIDSTTGGSVTTPGEGTHTYEYGQVVNLVAVPDEGHTFVNWSGNTSTIANPDLPSTTIVVMDDYHITANFVMFQGGLGEPENPYQIANWYHLDNVRNYLGSHFILVNDLGSETEGYDELAGPDANDGKGWHPIGTSVEGFGFSGLFDGAGCKISDLYVYRSEFYVGLFGFVDGGGQVVNTGLVDATVDGLGRVGSLIGQNYGSVSDCYSVGGRVKGIERIGGLVGQNNGTLSGSYFTGSVTSSASQSSGGGLLGHNEGDVGNCYAAGNVTGHNDVGGLVGKNNENATVHASYSTGNVHGNDNIGGLVGKNDRGFISDSCSSATVSGRQCVGGLVGKHETETVSNSYSTGTVTGTGQHIGGLVGKNDNDGTVSNSFWDTETSGQASSAGGTGQATAQMMDIATFSGADWDIVLIGDYTDETWYINDGSDYPRLSWQFVP